MTRGSGASSVDQGFPMLCFPNFFHTHYLQNAKAVLIQHCGMPLAFTQDNPFPPLPVPCHILLPLELAIRVEARAADSA